MSKDIIKYSSLHSRAPEEGFLCRPTWQQSSKTTSAESHPSTMQSVFQSTTGGTGFSFLADPSTRSPLGQFSSLSAPIPVLSQERSCFRELTGSLFCCRPDGSRAEIYLKREDLNHTGAHKINNSLGQALLCLRMNKRRIIAETGAGQHGVATVSCCSIFSCALCRVLLSTGDCCELCSCS